MKTIFLSAVITACCGLFSNNGFAQNEQPQIQKREEIIIRENNEAPSKMTIEIDSNNITVNGKPLSDFNGNVTITKRNFMGGEGNIFFTPGQHFMLNSESDKAFLGVLTAKVEKGAVIKNVVDGSSAQKAGLKEDDIITKLGDKEISSPDDLRNAVQAYKPGDKVTLSYLRDGKKKSSQLELGKTMNTSVFNFNTDSLRNSMNRSGLRRNYNFRMPQMPRSFYFNHFTNRPKMGMKIEDTENGNGVKVLDVEQGSAADKAGIKKDDIITEINGEKVNGVNDVMSQINQSANKSDYKIKVRRDNNEMNFDVVIPKVLKKINV
ncbi:MAG TPA: PDZ domain-containing protein [Hanamia sp.]